MLIALFMSALDLPFLSFAPGLAEGTVQTLLQVGIERAPTWPQQDRKKTLNPKP